MTYLPPTAGCSGDRDAITSYGALTSPESHTAQGEGRLLLLPVGAVEQHGDGLPLATDVIRAEHVAQRVAQNFVGRALVMPAIPYGVSPHHASLPGTVTLPPALFIQIIETIAVCLSESGWTRILVINGHGGNNGALSVVQQSLLATHPDFIFAWSPLTSLAPNANSRMGRSEISGHSGESETAQMLGIDPGLVDQKSLRAGVTALDQLTGRARLSRATGPSIAVTFDKYAPNGVLGDPTTVTAAEGQEILDEIVECLTDYAAALLAL